MSNTTSLYSNTSSGNATVPANNNTSLYNATGVPQVVNNNISVSGNILAGGYISAAGNVTGANLVTTGNVYAGNIIGNIVGNFVLSGGNTEVVFNNNSVACSSPAFTFNSTSNTLAVTGAVTATGNVTGNYILGNGSQLTGLPATYGNANVVTLLSSFGSNTVSTTGNITGGFILGNGSQLTGLPATYGNANVATLLAGFGSNSISTTGNITANYFIGNGSQLTDINAGNIIGGYGNANVANYLANFGSNSISTTGNISAGNVSVTGNIYTAAGGNNPVVIGQVSAVYGNTANASGSTLSFSIPSAGTWAIDFTINAQINKSSASNDFLTAGLFDSSNAQVGNTIVVISSTDGAARLYDLAVSGSGQYIITTTGAEVYTAQAITTAGVTSSSAFGTFVLLDPAFAISNVSYTGNLNFAGNITANAGNVTASDYLVGNYLAVTNSATVGSLSVTGDSVLQGNLQVNGNVTYIASNTVVINDKFINVANNAATASQANGGGIGVGPVGAEYATWSFSDANTAWQSNIKIEAPAVTTTGNVTANYVIGNGSLLTNINAGNIVGAYGNANVATFLGTGFGSNAITTTGNITAGNFIGNGQFLTNLTGANVTGQVANALVAGTVYVNAQPNITSVGTLSSLSVTGNVVGGNLHTAGSISATGGVNASSVTVSGFTTTAFLSVTGDVYGNGFISTVGNVTGGNLRTVGQVSATGNVTGNFFIGNGSQLTGISGGTYSNANVVALLNAFGSNSIITTGNIGNVTSKVGTGFITNLVSDTISSETGDFVTIENVSTTAISATGNIQGNFFIGNGSQLTGLAVSYGNANVASFMAAFGSNTISTTGTITTGNILIPAGGGIATDTISSPTGDFVTIEGVIAGAGIQSSGNAVFFDQKGVRFREAAVNGTNEIQLRAPAVVTTDLVFQLPDGYGNNNQMLTTDGTGNLSWSTAAGGNSTPSGSNLQFQYNNSNVFGGVPGTAFYTGNGVIEMASTKFEASGSNAQVTVPGAAGYVSVTGNVIAGNVHTVGQVSATGNVTGNYILGNGSQLTGISAAPGGSPFQFQYNNSGAFGGIPSTNYYSGNGTIEMALTKFEATGVSGIVTVPGTAGYVSVTGNVIAGNVFTGGTVSATGNITGNYFLGNGSQLTGITANATSGGSNTQIQFNDGGTFAGNAQMTFNKTTGLITLGNVTVSNLALNTASANFDTANVSTFQTSVPWRITVGNLYNGVANSIYSGANPGNALARMSPRVFVSDLINVGNNNQGTAQFGTQTWYTATANITNTNNRYTGTRTEVMFGGGSAGNTFTGSVPFGQSTQSLQTWIGAGTNANLSLVGNTISTGGFFQGIFNGINVQNYSAANSIIGTYNQLTTNNANASAFGNAVFQIGTYTQFNGTPANANITATTTAIGYYMPGTTGIYGSSGINGNIARQAASYYAFRNDDDLAKSRLGMLDRFHEFNANTSTTTGTVNIDKNSGQVQTIYPTGNVTIGTFSNFVTRVTKPDATFVNAADTVTLIIQQGATPYTVTMPTGNTAIRYAGGINVVNNTANTTTMISVTGVYDYTAGANEYLVTISPEFS